MYRALPAGRRPYIHGLYAYGHESFSIILSLSCPLVSHQIDQHFSPDAEGNAPAPALPPGQGSIVSQNMLAATLVSALIAAYVLPPVALLDRHCSRSAPLRAGVLRAQSLYKNDGGDSEVDWDAEAAALAKPTNPYFKVVKAIPVPDLISEFADSAPPDVQEAVRMTISKLLGNFPIEEAAITRVTSDKSIASLMFSMQMTGYMFRNAQYRRSLLESLNAAEANEGEGGSAAQAALPAVSGKIAVQIAEGVEAEVDAAAYMAELRQEVEGLRAQLTVAKVKQADEGQGVMQYLQSLPADEARQLTSEVSKEVLDAMSQLITKLLKEADVQDDAVMETSDNKMRELLVWQLVTGYKLRELEVKQELQVSARMPCASSACPMHALCTPLSKPFAMHTSIASRTSSGGARSRTSSEQRPS